MYVSVLFIGANTRIERYDKIRHGWISQRIPTRHRKSRKRRIVQSREVGNESWHSMEAGIQNPRSRR